MTDDDKNEEQPQRKVDPFRAAFEARAERQADLLAMFGYDLDGRPLPPEKGDD